VAILLADFFNLPVAVLHADYQHEKGQNQEKHLDFMVRR